MYQLRTISIKTQSRRLRNISVLLDALNKKGTPKSILQDKVIKLNLKHHYDFKRYISPSGEITSKSKQRNSQSFLNYYSALLNLDLANEQTGFVVPSRIGVTYKVLMELFNTGGQDNAYKLHSHEKAFFFYIILKKDADYFLTIMDLITKLPQSTISDYIKKFKETYLDRLELKFHLPINSVERTKIQDNILRVKNWRNAKRYCEDIVPPRVNWMIDLGLINKKVYADNKKVQLNETGQITCHIFAAQEAKILDVTDNWFIEGYGKLCARIFFDNGATKFWSSVSENEKHSLMKECLFHCQTSFITMGLPRLSVEQSYLFITIYLLFKRQVIIEFTDISMWIGQGRKIGSKKFALRQSARNYESYIAIADGEA